MFTELKIPLRTPITEIAKEKPAPLEDQEYIASTSSLSLSGEHTPFRNVTANDLVNHSGSDKNIRAVRFCWKGGIDISAVALSSGWL